MPSFALAGLESSQRESCQHVRDVEPSFSAEEGPPAETEGSEEIVSPKPQRLSVDPDVNLIRRLYQDLSSLSLFKRVEQKKS